MFDLRELFTAEEYRRCLRVAESRFGLILKDTGFSPRELVHELYIRLDRSPRQWCSTRHFRASCDVFLRFVAIDLYRRSAKARPTIVPIDHVQRILPGEDGPVQLDIYDALSVLQQNRPRQGHVVYYRFFVGLTVAETARKIDVSIRTVRRDTHAALSNLRLICC